MAIKYTWGQYAKAALVLPYHGKGAPPARAAGAESGREGGNTRRRVGGEMKKPGQNTKARKHENRGRMGNRGKQSERDDTFVPFYSISSTWFLFQCDLYLAG